VAILYCDGEDALVSEAARVEGGLQAHGGAVVERVPLEAVAGTEPFGFADGISQPILKGTFRAQGITDPLNLVAAGEFLLGYPDNRGYFPPTPVLEATLDPENLLPLVPGAREPQSAFAQTVVEAPRDLGRNGSFLVLRQLEQNVEGFWNNMKDLAREAGRPEEWVAAKIVGRWKDGSSLVRNPSFAASRKTSQAAPVSAGDNDFLYGVEDEQGHRCPFGAHIRRANPRDSFAPGSKDQIDISNRHRILRRGRAYRPGKGQKPGLMFACLNADLERQFEFIQQTWLNNTSFHGLDGEMDPLLDAASNSCFTIPTPDGPVKLTGLSQFVTVRGGGYFFLPGKRTLEFLASLSERTPPG
jgi:Dyp-type peroxidase family